MTLSIFSKFPHQCWFWRVISLYHDEWFQAILGTPKTIWMKKATGFFLIFPLQNRGHVLIF